MMVLDQNLVAGLLKTLNPTQEKVVRLYFGLGCQRSHSASEIARQAQACGLIGSGSGNSSVDEAVSSRSRRNLN